MCTRFFTNYYLLGYPQVLACKSVPENTYIYLLVQLCIEPLAFLVIQKYYYGRNAAFLTCLKYLKSRHRHICSFLKNWCRCTTTFVKFLLLLKFWNLNFCKYKQTLPLTILRQFGITIPIAVLPFEKNFSNRYIFVKYL